jgi:hypothetical protein
LLNFQLPITYYLQHTFIHPTVLIKELALAVAHVLVFGTFVPGALLEVLDHVLELLLVLVVLLLLLLRDYGSWVDLFVVVGL